VQLPSEFISMLPYLSTIVVLVLISRNPLWIRLNMSGRLALVAPAVAAVAAVAAAFTIVDGRVRVRRGRLESFELAPVIERHNQLAEGARG
jgi:ABC-type spermidine/putrescine transport system permease subunit II